MLGFTVIPTWRNKKLNKKVNNLESITAEELAKYTHQMLRALFIKGLISAVVLISYATLVSSLGDIAADAVKNRKTK